jgi:SAM-dependent methyltransferase
MIDYDLELRRHNEALRRAYGIRPADRVLDIGCGAGQSTRDAARMASEGVVLGVDRSQPMIDQARVLTRAAGVANAEYDCSDIEQRVLPHGAYDVAISRFGTMFFADPLAAFTNIRGALRAGGRLVMLVWQSRERNEWAVSIARAFAGDMIRQRDSELAFSFGDPDIVTPILLAAGFVAPTFDEVRVPVCYGPDADAALEFVLQFTNVKQTLDALPESERERTIEALRELFEAHRTDEGVCFDSRSWIVGARCR